MTTNKTPVYWRTKDGRKVVILFRCHHKDACEVYCQDEDFSYEIADAFLTPWVEPEARTVYVHWWRDSGLSIDNAVEGNRHRFKAIKKITITEGEFDE